ncbi:type II toxin-antitoxin system VapB family antitoxin [Bradyrhizobium sp. AT1]|uniref:type II toxin-antitoxin system VapB family antitoxin n=1 Tax=Bradyrhizobium sp. AT1 TaxID=574934 RepID=UPI0009FD2D51|nr:type II toxin-antitoxin system VapB family antitoxin [Bradyrhizobium sp. AT1]
MSSRPRSLEPRELAAELARLTEDSLTVPVIAIRERLDRVRREQEGSLADRLLTIGQDCAKRLKEPRGSVDCDDLLYNERGLPR